MDTTKIFIYDNNTGREIPKKVGSIPVEFVLGSTVSEIHSNMNYAQLFCVFTPVSDADIIVPSKWDYDVLQNALKFGNYSYRVKVSEESIWYSDKAEKNIIISNSVTLDARNISTLLTIYLSEIASKKRAEGKLKKKEVYRVSNIRNGEEIIRTPNINEAMSVCDASPCTVVINKDDEIIYKTSFGKVAVPYKASDHLARHKAKYPGNNGIFKFKNR